MRTLIPFFIIAALYLGTVCWVTGEFDTRAPWRSVYSGTFKSLQYQDKYGRHILTDVTLFLHPLPDGFVEQPTQIWPGIKLMPEGIFAQTDIWLGARNYAAVTRGLRNFFRDPDQRILLKHMSWVEAQPGSKMKVDVYTVEESEEINVIDGYFDITVPSRNVYHVTLDYPEKGADSQGFKEIRIHEETLYDVMIPLHRLPEGVITTPTQIWPGIKLMPEGIFAHVDIQMRDISTHGYEGATAYLKKLVREANNKIILKNLFWKAERSTEFATDFDKVRISCEIYIIKDGKEISVGVHMIEAGYGIYPGC